MQLMKLREEGGGREESGESYVKVLQQCGIEWHEVSSMSSSTGNRSNNK